MPAQAIAFAAVAAALSDANARDPAAVSRFYRRRLRDYPEPARALVADFLIGASGTPSPEALDRLRNAVSAAKSPLVATTVRAAKDSSTRW